MKVRSLLFGMLCMLALGASLASCVISMLRMDISMLPSTEEL